jgi:hypothetical protein
MNTRFRGSAWSAAAFVVLVACERQTVEFGPPPSTEGPSFSSPDSGATADSEAAPVSYCVATTCVAPFTTCSDSRFPCDVNLMTDADNCGECGFKCPSGALGATFSCVSGKCAMRCVAQEYAWNADCNGLLDDQCEVRLGTNDNCNGCGDTCPDPAKPCVFDETSGKGKCGCDAGYLHCGSCVDPKSADDHCGACGTACDPTAGGLPPVDHAYYGCANSECGHLKCQKNYGDCDGNEGNGCETSLVSDTNCGGCNKACDPGQTCERNRRGDPECMCPAGKTLCKDVYGARCVDFSNDPRNCGGCDVDCTFIAPNMNNVGICTYGSCGITCMQGWGDCNDDPKDGCEVNLGSDQQNCGACGKACDILAGQPCIAGQCAVKPCQEEGKGTQ